MPNISISNQIKNRKQNATTTNDTNSKRKTEQVPKSADSYASSSEEDEDIDEKKILNGLYQHYGVAGNTNNGFLENFLQSGGISCLICIATVRRADAIWSCRHCYCIFHLNCIRRWAKDSIAQQNAKKQQQQNDQGYYNQAGEYIPPKKIKTIHWFCPQCRNAYEPNEQPQQYECFCGKEINPKTEQWLVPHSCGEMCGKPLNPDCGHKCMMLCHPGPCAPCAQYKNTTCRCGKSPPQLVRCYDKNWQCEQKCKNLLACGKHLCNQPCHATGECPPCGSTSMQPCECGNETKKRSCSDLKWHCKKVCGQKYACNIHVCKKVCHAKSGCGECPLGLPRSCPCGKTTVDGPCTEDIDTCGDTCQKMLPCGRHTCTQRCHRGACNQCLVIVSKRCRCGLHEKELACSKEFTCETKCKQLRDCGKHPCNRKCCNGDCPTCDKICGKTLSCKKHKCQSVCHDGPCYPCKLQSQINCSCGKTTKIVPCGRERSIRIHCNEPCRKLSKCHHENKHRCHKNECPPCVQKCGLPNDTSGCLHICEARCHGAVKIIKPLSPNPKNVLQPNPKIEYTCMPHPRCEQKVLVTCIGGHEEAEWPCWNSKPTSCQRKCNRLLRCGNHRCDLVCHKVPNPQDMKEQEGCGSCQNGCNIPRPLGCVHPCTRPCHAPPCKPCAACVRTKCHCGLTQVVYTCAEFFGNNDDIAELEKRQEKLKSCGDRCQKNYPCGHRCGAICHSGECPNPETCRKKVRVYCECKQLKLDISCDRHRAGHIKSIPCNESCIRNRAELEIMKNREAERLRLLEAEKNRLELEQFEKKFSKRKYKERKIGEREESKRRINWKMLSIYVGVILAITMAVAVALYAEN